MMFKKRGQMYLSQRGHNRQPVFIEERDYQYCLANLQEGSAELGSSVYAFSLLTNHIHLIVGGAPSVTAIPALMKRLAGRQTRFVNML